MSGSTGTRWRWTRVGARLGLALALLGTGAAGVWVAKTGPRRLKHVFAYMRRIENGKAESHTYVQLAREGRGLEFVRRFLEERATDPRADEAARKGALKGLVFNFPDSESSRAVRRFEELANRNYFIDEDDSTASARPLSLAERTAAWRAFCDENVDFPGRDNAGYELGRCYEQQGEGTRAFLVFVEALDWGDKDAAGTIVERLTNILDAQVPVEDAIALAARGVGPRWQALLEYSAAVKLVQAHRFVEGLARLDSFVRAVEGGAEVALLAHAPHYFVWRNATGEPVVKTAAFLADVRAQRAVWARLAALEGRARAATDPGARALALVRMADRVLGEPHAFENLVLHDRVMTNRYGERPWRSANETRDTRYEAYANARNHLAQAAALYEEAAALAGRGRDAARALVGVAAARVALLGFWGKREGHAVPRDFDALFEDAARAIVRAKAATREGMVADATIEVAFAGMTREVVKAVHDDADRSPWGTWGDRHLFRELRKRVQALARTRVDTPELALGREKSRGR